ncbi:hypothetical protein L3Y34_006946 [Caenorhabditis briggsae]|uniref:Receptor L-domain domain-containing protein n=1 Tax=Caenorhabditis briggsae TaxID=6238 RepID=A0AAE9CZ27_CAEBR|nr:hypothetical protein L3Y34_006946 [Caenorhabditis briggsae]
MERLVGGIRIENSNLTSLSFFKTTGSNFVIYCKTYGIYLRNNQYLVDADFLTEVQLDTEYSLDGCGFEVENNKMLDVEQLCSSSSSGDVVDIKTIGNLKNCQCQGDSVTEFQLFRNCTTIHNGLHILNGTDPSEFSVFGNAKFIKGQISIQNSNIQNLSFLRSWRTWNVRINYTMILNFQNNTEMTRLALPNFPKVENAIYSESANLMANFENLHPQFCLTIEEFLYILENHFSMRNFHAKVCEDIGDIGEKVLCRFESMYDLPNNCDIILGNLNIGPGDEEDITKVMDVWLLFGSLIIQNTQLASLEHLSGLKYILKLDENSPLIQIVYNPKLKKTTLLSLEDNIFVGNNSKKCNIVDKWSMFKKQLNLDYTGSDCGNRVLINASKRLLKYSITIILVYFSLFM